MLYICCRLAEQSNNETAAGKASAWAQLVTATNEPALPPASATTRQEGHLDEDNAPEHAIKPSDIRKSADAFEDKRTSMEMDFSSPIAREC